MHKSALAIRRMGSSQPLFLTILSGLFMHLTATADTVFEVTNSGASDYVIDGQNDPALDLMRGTTYTFNLNASGHPFWIKTAQVTGTGSSYDSGVTGNGTAVGTLTFTVSLDAPDTLYYICQFHSGMRGTLNISDPPGPATYYVSVSSGSDTNSGLSWAAAKQTIQAAVDAAASNDTVLVTNGTYAAGGRPAPGRLLTNRVVIAKSLTVASVNGPDHTHIRGAGPIGSNAVRCVWMTDGASLEGFTLTNGATRMTTFDPELDLDASGGGVYAFSPLAAVSNCVLSGNSADYYGGGAYSGTLIDCSFTSNRADNGSGGAAGFSVLDRCRVLTNFAAVGGGVVRSTVHRSLLAGNTALVQHGGAALLSDLYNSLLTGNRTPGGEGAGAYGGSLTQCTVVSNEAAAIGSGASLAAVTNSIIYFNPNFSDEIANVRALQSMLHSCTLPMPTNAAGSITNNPQLVNVAGGDYRLAAGSPCRDTGSPATPSGGLDLDGNPRIVHGYVDMGAYEYQGGTGQADFDEDGMGNGDEGVAGTDFTDQSDTFTMLVPPMASAGTLSFQSVTGRLYAAEYNGDLLGTPQIWTEFTNNVAGTGSTLILVDPAASATNRNYRLKVRLAAP